MSDIRGKIRVGFPVPLKLLKIGALPVGAFGEPPGPRSNSSHVYVRESLSGSSASPVRKNGVPVGITYPVGLASTDGGVFPVNVTTGHAAPPPSVV